MERNNLRTMINTLASLDPFSIGVGILAILIVLAAVAFFDRSGKDKE